MVVSTLSRGRRAIWWPADRNNITISKGAVSGPFWVRVGVGVGVRVGVRVRVIGLGLGVGLGLHPYLDPTREWFLTSRLANANSLPPRRSARRDR